MITKEEKNRRRRIMRKTPEYRAKRNVYNALPRNVVKRDAYFKEYEARPESKVKRAERLRAKKTALWEILGPYCRRCGYNKNTAALSFHHLDPSQKEKTRDILAYWSQGYLDKAIDKIKQTAHIILCANCHAEVHYPECVVKFAPGPTKV